MSRATRVWLGADDMALARHYAKTAERGGTLSVRERPERMAELAADQLVSSTSELALHLWMFGRRNGRSQFSQARELADRLHRDDGDVLGFAIDVKGTLRDYSDTAIGTFHLPVRPHEHHPDRAYVFALVDREHLDSVPVPILLCGFDWGWALTTQADPGHPTFGTRAGLPPAYICPAGALQALPHPAVFAALTKQTEGELFVRHLLDAFPGSRLEPA